MPKPPGLSKSRLLSMFQCEKRLWLEVHKKDLVRITPQQQAVFDTGNAVGDIACKQYGAGGGHYIEYDPGLSKALEETQRLMKAGNDMPLFEATFEHEGVLVRIDVLLPDTNGYHLIEVKSGRSVKDHYIADCAVQAWVFSSLEYPLDRVSLTHVNSDFVYPGQQKFAGLLKENDVTELVAATVPEVSGWVDRARAILASDEPDIQIGSYCGKPYECDFLAYCSKTDCQYPVAALKGGRNKLGELLAAGYRDLRDVPEDRLSASQRRIWTVTCAGTSELAAGAAEFAISLEYPRYYLDFETISVSIPVWEGSSPGDVFPYQYSIHIENTKGEHEHKEFLDLSGGNPARACAEALLRDLGKTGPILMYTAYEKDVLKSLASMFTDLRDDLNSLIERLVDLHPPTKVNYYHPDMLGSWSIKAVIPTIAPDLNYKALEEVQDGQGAQRAYLEAIDPQTSAERRECLKERLLKYCELDTLAMIRLVEYLGQGHN